MRGSPSLRRQRETNIEGDKMKRLINLFAVGRGRFGDGLEVG